MEPGTVPGSVERLREDYSGPLPRYGRPAGDRFRARQHVARNDSAAHQLARGLGWFSIGVGVAAVLAPRSLSQFVGLRHGSTLVRFVGLREIATGFGILTQRRRAPWLWGRTAGDTMDFALLASALRLGNPGRHRAFTALAGVAGITALDIYASQRLSRAEGGAREGAHAVLVEHAATINKPPEDCYRFWRDLENLPRFMDHVESVQLTGEQTSHWVARAPAGSTVEWDAEIVEDRPNELIAWRSLPGGGVENAGWVRFDRAPAQRGTIVRVQMHYTPPAGRMGTVVARLFREEPRVQIREDLRRFKQVLETGEIPTTVGQSSGPRSLLARATREGRYT